MSNFRTIDRETGFLLPPSVDEWLPEKHLARFVVEVVEGLDLRRDERQLIAVRGRRRIIRECCWAFWFTAMRRGCFRAASWSGRLTTRWRSGSSRPTIIPTTTRSRRSGGAFSKEIESAVRSSAAAGAGDGRAEDGDGRRWTGRRSTPTPAGTARFPMSTPARSRRN